MSDAAIVEQIYEAAVVPELWPALLEALARETNSSGGAISAIEARFAPGPAVLRCRATPSYQPVYGHLEAMMQIPNPRFLRAIGHRQWYFQPDTALCSEEELAKDEVYARFVRPHGFEWTIGCPIPVPSADMVVFDFGRRAADGPFDAAVTLRFNELKPHLARSAFVAARLGLERARAAVATLEAIGLPGAAISASGKVLGANPGFEALAPRVGIGPRDRLFTAIPATTQLLHDMLADRTMDKAGLSRSLPLSGTADAPPLILHLLPIRRAANDIFARADWLLVVTPVTAAPNQLSHVVAGLFDLTPAEINLANAIAGGESITRYAQQRSISRETARSQLKALMSKTGTHRQIELSRLLSSARSLSERKPRSARLNPSPR